MKKLFLLSLSLILFCFGCAHIDPGADTIVVRAEQTEVMALSTFDLLLNTDNSNRELYKEKLPAFHAFCEYLRAPVSVHGTNYPRSLAMIMTMQEIKLAYKKAKNADRRELYYSLFSAVATLTSALDTANLWMRNFSIQDGSATH